VILNEDYRDLLSAFQDAGVEYLLVGAYAMAVHGFPRSTMDIDLWVHPTPENGRRVLIALQAFGAPLHDLTLADLTHDDTVFQIGVAPRRIDVMTGLTALDFPTARARAKEIRIDGIPVQVLGLEELLTNKERLGRHRDLADAEVLRALIAKAAKHP
jgi:predicted nucleotidyltransferase